MHAPTHRTLPPSQVIWFVCLALGLAAMALPTYAQLDPDDRSFGLYQDGRLVGEIYRADTDPQRYVEHWVLYTGYVYPTAQNAIVTEIIPGLTRYTSVPGFLRRVPFAQGSRYVKVVCDDSATLPGR